MAQITTNIAGLNISKKLEKGATIITKSTGNPLVPGNGPLLTAFSAAQTKLNAANAAVLAMRDSYKLLMLEREQALSEWDDRCTALADLTQTATGGDENAIISAGFSVRGPNTPSQPVSTPENLTATTNGSPGITKLRWKPVHNAVNYLIQCSTDPDLESSWVLVDSSTKANAEVPGAVPGKVCWFRVSAIGATSESAWSAPAQRAVL